ncbi:DUF2513 domain-containing protein [Pseudooceanicola sp.]|uniref:DUF2513 domain-containing protein n=1 Tax=Pseudooceanicola sp. TaxID=1914328 RepID=UPI004057E737
MKRDLDLQRNLLLEVEGCNDLDGLGFVAEALKGHGHPEGYLEQGRFMNEVEEYNLKKLEEAGYISTAFHGEFWVVNLTHAGHEFVDSTRDNGIWHKTKTALVQFGGSVTLEGAKVVASGIVKAQIKQRLGLDIEL